MKDVENIEIKELLRTTEKKIKDPAKNAKWHLWLFKIKKAIKESA